MISRRSVLAAPLVLAAQSASARVTLILSPLPYIPDDVARESIVFPRAYLACPRTDQARRSVLTGRFPHAVKGGDPSLASVLGARYREVSVTNEDEIRRIVRGPDKQSMIVLAPAGTAEDERGERFVRFPAAIRFPDVIAPREAPEILLSGVDLMPTIVSLAGLAPPEGVQGRDLSSLIRTRRGEVPDSVYVEGRLGQSDEWRAVVRGYDKIVVNLREEIQGLYNLADDPAEVTDLAGDSAQRLKRDGLLALVRVWMRRTGDGYDPSGAKLRR